MKLKETHKYDDLIALPHPVFAHRARMTNYDRAAQFSPFAALTGYEAVLAESARLTENPAELEDGALEELNEALREIREKLPENPEISATWFVRDARKTGGSYVSATGRAKKICDHSRLLFLTDGRVIPLADVVALQLLE